MKLRSLVAVLACLPLTACLDAKEEFALAADGSGSLKQAYVTDLKATKELLDFFLPLLGDASTGAKVPDPLPNPVAPAWLKQDAAKVEGYTLSKAEETTAEQRRTDLVEAKFTCLEVAAKAGAFATSNVSLEKTEKGTWKLTLRDAWSKSQEASGGALGGMDVATLLPMLEPQMKGLRLERRFTLPAKILETNGTKSEDGKTVTWVVDYAKIVDGKDLEMTVEFEGGEGIKLAPFAYRRRLDGLMNRALESPPKETKPPEPPAAPVTPEGK